MVRNKKSIELGEFVIMPNHIHSILILHNNPAGTGHALSEKDTLSEKGVVQSAKNPSAEKPAPIGKNRFQNIGKNSVSSIIGGYKSAVTKHANRLGFEFAWQTRFYERIIKHEKAYKNITKYIYNNPLNWCNDKFYL